MKVLVCVKRVPETSDTDLAIATGALDIDRDDLVYGINEPDNYAVEEALRIAGCAGGDVTIVTVGGEDDEEVLRRELAMGATQAVRLSDDAFAGSDGRGIATILAAFVRTRPFDLILTGVQADDGAAQVGGMLAALLDYPFASLVSAIDVENETTLRITREIEGGSREISDIDLPCVLSIQTGINEPRYVGMRGIRQAASLPIPSLGAADLGIAGATVGSAAARVTRHDYFFPAADKSTRMLAGSREANVEVVVELLKARGGAR